MVMMTLYARETQMCITDFWTQREREGGSCLGTHVRIKDFKILKIKN